MVYMYTIIFAIIGGIVYRWRGSDYSMHPFSEVVFSLPYAYCAFLYTDNIFLSVLVFGLTMLATLTGHGNAIDMGTHPRGEDETMEWAVKWFHGDIKEYWYDFILMAWLGLLKSLACGLVCLNPILAVSGLMKAPAYSIGHLFKNKPTEKAEFLTGFFLWGFLSIPFADKLF